MKQSRLFTVFIFAAGLVFAADDPTVVIGDQKYDKSMCIQKGAAECVNTICQNSEDRNCQDKCKTDAENKCALNKAE